MTSTSPISDLKGIGPALAVKFKVLGIRTVHDLIEYYPRRYDDYSLITPIASLQPGPVTLRAVIKQAKGRYVRRGMHVTEAVASDDSGSVRLVWFNQPYREQGLKKEQEYYISGAFELRRGRFSIMNPSAELVSDFPLNTARIVPIYRETKGLKSNQIRSALSQVTSLIERLPETLPEWLLEQEDLMPFASAMLAIHFPESSEQLKLARHRLAFEEVFSLNLASLMNKLEIAGEQAPPVAFEEKLAKDFVGSLPFDLTNAQRAVIWQIYQDMAGNTGASHSSGVQGAAEQRTESYGAYGEGAAEGATQQYAENASSAAGKAGRQAGVMRSVRPMNRLVEGDVGAGKTVVAAMAALMVLHHGHTVALMAPTELLARQHAATLQSLLEPLGYGRYVGLLVGSLPTAQKKAAHEAIRKGDMRFVVGTHAVIQDAVDMQNLELVIIDEQHRFGVEQRKALQKKAGHMPHILSLTATPIPRTLALTLYGELDISILDQKPVGRLPVITEISPPSDRPKLYARVKQQLNEGRQMFVVCPLVSDSAVLDAESAEKVYEELRTRHFKSYRVGLLHGQMKADEKQAVMQQFVAHKIDILVATTVIEVGVDVPNATIMILENAERFGLSQIHQLRGRVGRSSHQGYCFLMLGDNNPPSKRLEALVRTDDGFKLAELDLRLRGPGAIYGTFQHGQLDLRVAQLSDTRLLVSARKAAEAFLEQDNLLHYTELHTRINRLRAVTNLN